MARLNDLLRLPLPLVLASQSPRRQDLLRNIGLDFDVVVPSIDENDVSPLIPPHDYVTQLAIRKAQRGAQLVAHASIVIGSDTTVVLDGTILNKPIDAEDAVRMLRLLSGRTHTVFTGVALVDSSSGRTSSACSSTHVTFRELRNAEIASYVAGGSPLDKAGAYGIQHDLGAVFVRKIDGCYNTVVGLPLELLYTMLEQFVAQPQHD